jgi:tetratricopeptide (TPR) repeat protein
MRCHDERAEGRFETSEGRLFLVASLPAFSVYLATLAPTVSGEDSGELITAAYTLGIAHPPGYPLWCLLGKLFSSAIPFGTIAFRVNLVSAVFGALAVGVLALIAKRLSGRASLALVSALLFAFSRDFWSQSVVAEVYTLNVFLFLVLLDLTLRFDETRKTRWLYLLSFALGLGFTNHSTILALAPVFAGWLILRHLDLLKLPALYLNLPAAFLLGFSIVLYLPIRSSADPLLDWGDPETLGATADHLLRRQYAAAEEIAPRTLARQLLLAGRFLGAFFEQFTPWLAALAPAGALIQKRRDRGSFLLLLLFFVLTSYGFIWLLNHPADRQSLHLTRVFFLPAYAIAALWIAIGLGALVDGVERRVDRAANRSRWALRSMALIAVATPLATHFSLNDQRGERLAEDWGRNILGSLKPDAILLPTADHSTFPLLYLQAVEGLRPDVVIGNKYGLIEDRLFGEIFTGENAPKEALPLGAPTREKERYLIERSGRPVYLTVKSDGSLPPGYKLLPYGLVFEAVREGMEASAAALDALWKSFSFSAGSLERPPGNFTADLILSDYHYARARHALLLGRDAEALCDLENAARHGAGLKEVLNNLGGTLAEARKPELALRFLRQALALDPDYELALKNLASAHFALGRYLEGLSFFERAARLDPEISIAQLGLARANRARGFIASAYQAYRSALAIEPRSVPLRKEINALVRESYAPGDAERYLVADEPPPLAKPAQ